MIGNESNATVAAANALATAGTDDLTLARLFAVLLFAVVVYVFWRTFERTGDLAKIKKYLNIGEKEAAKP